MIRVQLNDSIFVDVNTDDPQKAAEGARTYFAREHPDAFKAWESSRPLPGFFQSFGRAARGSLGSMVQGVAPVAELAGAPGVAAGVRNVAEAISGPDDPATRGPEWRDFTERPAALAGNVAGGALGSIASFLATGLGVGAAIRAGLGAAGVGAGLGATVAGTAVATGALTGAGEMEQLLRAEGVEPQRAAALSATLGPLIGVAEQGALLGAMRRALGREVSQATAQAILSRSALSGIGRTAAAEGTLEAGGEAARQGLAAAETGNLNLEQRSLPVVLGALGGVAGGAAFGTPATLMERGAARREVAPPSAPPPAAAAPPAPTPWLPPEPVPFVDVAEAQAFINENRAARPGVNLPTDEALLAHVNTLRRNAWEQETSDLRLEAIRQALGGPPTAELNDTLSPQATVGQQVEARIARGQPISPTEGRVLRPGAQTIEEQAEIVLPTLLELGQAETLDLQAIKPADVAEYILGTIDASGPTDAEVKMVENTLRGLKRARYLTDGAEPGTFTLAQRNTGRPSQRLQPLEQPGTADQQAAQAMLDLIRGYVEVEQTDPQRQGTPGTRALSVDEIKQRTRLLDGASPTLQEYMSLYLTTPDPNVRANLLNRFEGFVQPAAIAPPASLQEGDRNLSATTSPRVATSNKGVVGNWEQTADPEVVAALKDAAFEKQEEARQGTPEQRKAFFDGLLTPDGQRLLQQMVAGEKGIVTSNRLQQLFAREGQPISKEMAVAAYQAARQGGVLNRLGAVNPNFTAQPTVVEKKPLEITVDKPSPPKPAVRKPLAVDKPAARPPLKITVDKDEASKAKTERVRGFVTEDGTTYELNNDGSTIREGKERSARTIYVAAEDAKQFKMLAKDGRLIVKKDKISLLAKDGKNFKVLAKDVPFNDAPNRKLVPIALNNGTKYELGTLYSEATVGVPISDMVSFAEIPTQPQGQRTQEEVSEAVADFYKMVGTSGRLELAQRLLVQDLDAEVQAAAAAVGINHAISGYAQGDLAVLSLGNSSMPLNQVAIHEGWHVAENIGLITPSEVDLLNANLDVIRDGLRPLGQKWGFDVDTLPPQEVRAYGINARLTRQADFGWINSIFDKVKALLGRIRNFMRGRGFTDWRDIYDSFAGGERASFENAQHVGFPINFSALMQDAVKRAKVTDLPQFKNWFGASKIVDNKGRPKIVYHGTTAIDKPFEIFITTSKNEQLGAHFGTLRAAHAVAALEKSRENHGVIYPVYIKIENPLRLEDIRGHWAWSNVSQQIKELVANGTITHPDAANIIKEAERKIEYFERAASPDLRPIARERVTKGMIEDLGYDGVVYANDVEDNGRDSYIVFRPEQIKSAVGNSTFNPEDQRIHFAAPTLPTDTATAHKVVKDHLYGSRRKGILRWMGSPILTMGKVHAGLRPAADVQKLLHTRTNEFNNETEEMLNPAAQLEDAERAEVTKLLDLASRTGKQSDISKLSAAAQKVYKDTQAMFQRAFDYAIEGLVMEHYRQDGKSPAEKAKLDKLWARHAGKHLWEIPKMELKAASSAGWEAMQELEKQRNPFYFPQVADGTHFVAAYKKGKNGEKVGAPLRMYAYTPNTLMQRMRGQPDPVVALKEELAREFDPAKHYIMQEGVEFTRDQEANSIRNERDLISQYLQELKNNKDVQDSQSAQQLLGRMGRQLDKLNVSRVFKPNQDILRAVNDKNASRYLLEQAPQYLLGLSKVQARWFTESVWTKALENVGPKDKAFLNDLRDYSTTPTEAFGGLRTMMFFTYLGAAPDTAAMNALQMLQTTLPMMARDGANLGHVLRAAKEVVAAGGLSSLKPDSAVFADKVSAAGKTPDEKAALDKAGKMGVFSPVFTNESRGQFVSGHFAKMGVANPGRWADNMNKLARMAGSLMQSVEQMNRAATFLGAYRAAKEKPEIILRNNRLTNRNLDVNDAFSYAVNMVDDTQFVTSKEDRAYIQRFTPAAEVATQFLSFPLKMFELWLKNGHTMLQGIYKQDPFLARAGAVGFMGMALPIVALAGIWALPGADFTKELLERLTEFWPGTGTQNFDADMRRLLGGGTFADALLRGIPHAGGWVSLNKRLAIDPLPFNDLTSLSVATLAGPAGSYAESWVRNFPTYLANGDYFNAAAAILPRALGNVVRAGGVAANEEMYTLRGNRVISPQMVAEIDGQNLLFPSWVKMAVGFQPPAFTNARELLVRAEEIDRQMRAPTERFNKNAARYMVQMIEAQQDGDVQRSQRAMENLRELIRETVEQNARTLDQSRWININMDAVRRRALSDLQGRGSVQSIMREVSPRSRGAIQEELSLR